MTAVESTWEVNLLLESHVSLLVSVRVKCSWVHKSSNIPFLFRILGEKTYHILIGLQVAGGLAKGRITRLVYHYAFKNPVLRLRLIGGGQNIANINNLEGGAWLKVLEETMLIHKPQGQTEYQVYPIQTVFLGVNRRKSTHNFTPGLTRVIASW